MDIVTIDFETYYDKDFSLSKITTESYVRSPEFEVIGVGIKINNYPTDWYSGDNVGKFLNSLDYRDKAILCHHTAFDGAILAWNFGIKPKLWLDTLSMARPLHNMTVGGSLKALANYYGIGQKGDEVINEQRVPHL
jgi:DNA polymerase III epsilon subunit-like protein